MGFTCTVGSEHPRRRPNSRVVVPPSLPAVVLVTGINVRMPQTDKERTLLWVALSAFGQRSRVAVWVDWQRGWADGSNLYTASPLSFLLEVKGSTGVYVEGCNCKGKRVARSLV